MNDLDYIDHLILHTIYTFGILNDLELSRQLHCPRMLLLSHLDRLINDKYVDNQNSNQYSLLEKGIREMIPLTHSTRTNEKDIFSDVAFDWDYLYIPEEGWDDS